MKSILDRSFRYTSSAQTDIRKTFARARKQLAEQREQQVKDKVTPFGKRSNGRS